MKVRAVTGARTITSPANGGATVLSDTSSVTLMAASDYRKSFSVTNQGTTIVYVKLGASATSSSWHYILPGGGATDDGNGGSVSIDGYVGQVTVCSASTGRVSYVEFG
jgi:hypothetical protein